VTQPRLQEIGGNKPQYFNAHSILSNVASITTPYTYPVSAPPTVVSVSPEPAARPDLEPTERSAEGEIHHPFAFNTAGYNVPGSRSSFTSGLLSIITLPSFITNDRSQLHSSPVGGRIESPVRPYNHHRNLSSLFGRRLSGTDSILPVSVNDEGMSSKWSLHIITSALEWSDSTSSSVRLHSPSRSPRSFQGRLNLSFDVEDEAAMRWKKLPSLPSTQGASSIHSPHSRRANEVEEFSTERLPTYCEKELKPPGFLAAHVPLPPSPSTPAPSVSPLSYASPSPGEIPPTNGFTTPYASYPPLPPSIPPSPGSFSYPSTPRSDEFVDVYTIRPADRTVSLSINTPHRLSGFVSRTHSYTPATPTIFAHPGNNSGSLPYVPNDDGTGRFVYHRSEVSAYSRFSTVQEVLLPPPPSLVSPSSPSTPPRGPRPLPTPGQPSRSRPSSSQTSSTGQLFTRK